MRLFQDAPGLLHAAFAAGDLDRVGRSPRAIDRGIPLPLNDANVVARILAFTPAGGESFYYTSGLNNTPQMIIADTTTTGVTLDFSDTALLAGTLADPLFRLVELGECAGVIGYASRLFWWGERNKVDNFRNLSFDGGFVGSGSGVRPPLGWTSDGTFGGAGGSAFSALWGGAWEIAGDNVANDKGMITQAANVDSNGVPIIRRARAIRCASAR